MLFGGGEFAADHHLMIPLVPELRPPRDTPAPMADLKGRARRLRSRRSRRCFSAAGEFVPDHLP